jgi:DNA-binding NtrC family response regulator
MTTETIMVIDDDRDLRESIVEILEDNDFTVVGCESAEVALQKIKLEIPHVIILDNMMPGMGGMAFIPLVKSNYPNVLIIMITAFQRSDQKSQTFPMG